MNRVRKRLTYANVMSSIAVFLVLGGATAVAATHLGKNSVGTRQLKANAVTTKKLKKDAVTATKIKNGAVTGEKVDVATLGTVPNSATTNVVKAARGTIPLGGEATAVEYGPLKISVRCVTYGVSGIAAHAYISSTTEGSAFSSWRDGSRTLGPATPEAEREVSAAEWNDSNGPYEFDGPSDVNVSASASHGQGCPGPSWAWS